jgi:hypothetical protein
MRYFIDFIANNLATLSVLGASIFAFLKWRDQRKRELQEKRFEQYWKLVDISQETVFLAKQRVSILLLRRYPEYQEETLEFLNGTKKDGGPWFSQNQTQIERVIEHFEAIELPAWPAMKRQQAASVVAARSARSF